MATTPSRALLTGTVTWSDSSTFDGYLLLGLVLPENSDGQWPTLAIEGLFPPQRMPIWTWVPITAGVFDTNTYVFYNTSLTPPNTRYVAYWYDTNKRRIFPATGDSPTPFTIAANPYAITLPTLTVPSTSSTLPAPQDTNLGV